jgi:L-malate glycosyltransferase
MNLKKPEDFHIAHIISALGKGGMEFAVSRLAIEQKRMGCDVHAICIRELGPTAENLKEGNVPVHLSKFKSRVHPVSLLNLKKLLIKLRINVVQTHNYRPNVSGCIAAKWAGIPAVISSLRTVNRWDSRRQYWMDRILCRWRNAIVCVSNEVRERYLEKIKCDPEKLHVIHNGISPQLLDSSPDADYLYDKYGLDKNHRHLISIARLVKIKDHSTLLHAFKKISDQKKDITLLILGDGPLREKLENQAKELGIDKNVKFVGHQNNIAEWLKIADISVLSTHIEGFSSTILESMACGVPMIATAVGGNLEAINNGETGFLVPHEDPEAIAEKILHLLENNSITEKIIQNARDMVRKNFTITATAEKTLKLYRYILNKRL